MQIPRIFHGRYRDVRPRLMRVLRTVARGGDWVGQVTGDGFLDARASPGLIVGDGPSSLLGRDVHFQMWWLWTESWLVEPYIPDDVLERFFQQSLAHPWAVLGLTRSRNSMWFEREDRHVPLLRAVAPWWETFAALGPRYSNGSRQGLALWQVPNTVVFVCARRGMPIDVLRAPPEPGGFARMLEAHGVGLDPG